MCKLLVTLPGIIKKHTRYVILISVDFTAGSFRPEPSTIYKDYCKEDNPSDFLKSMESKMKLVRGGG